MLYITEKALQSTSRVTRENGNCLQFSRHSLLYAGRLKAPYCFIQAFVATSFCEHTRSQTEYDITAILLDSIISIVTVLNS